MKVSVAYAIPEKQVWLKVDVPEQATVFDAIVESKIMTIFPELDINEQKVGIYGKICKLETALKDGDRVEIYRKITADPATVPRRDKDDDDDD